MGLLNALYQLIIQHFELQICPNFHVFYISLVVALLQIYTNIVFTLIN